MESERANLADLIRSDINDKRIYAARRLLEVMCEGEPYGLSRLGTAKEDERISLQRLNSHYQAILPAARLELFYCGAAQEKRDGRGLYQGLCCAAPTGCRGAGRATGSAKRRRRSAGWWRRRWM